MVLTNQLQWYCESDLQPDLPTGSLCFWRRMDTTQKILLRQLQKTNSSIPFKSTAELQIFAGFALQWRCIHIIITGHFIVRTIRRQSLNWPWKFKLLCSFSSFSPGAWKPPCQLSVGSVFQHFTVNDNWWADTAALALTAEAELDNASKEVAALQSCPLAVSCYP